MNQGTLIAGTKEEGNRRWIAIILDEKEIEQALDEVNGDAETYFELSDIEDDLQYIVRKYTDSLLEGGADWSESLKIIIQSVVETKEV